jgi:hypothetical protein
MDALDRADRHAGGVLDVLAGWGDHVRHVRVSSMLGHLPPLAASLPVPRHKGVWLGSSGRWGIYHDTHAQFG